MVIQTLVLKDILFKISDVSLTLEDNWPSAR